MHNVKSNFRPHRRCLRWIQRFLPPYLCSSLTFFAGFDKAFAILIHPSPLIPSCNMLECSLAPSVPTFIMKFPQYLLLLFIPSNHPSRRLTCSTSSLKEVPVLDKEGECLASQLLKFRIRQMFRPLQRFQILPNHEVLSNVLPFM